MDRHYNHNLIFTRSKQIMEKNLTHFTILIRKSSFVVQLFENKHKKISSDLRLKNNGYTSDYRLGSIQEYRLVYIIENRYIPDNRLVYTPDYRIVYISG